MSNDNLKKLKDEELKILDYFAEFCEKNNLNYYIMYGTLLGAVRHKGFIPWDDDIDVCMPPADYQKFINIFFKLLKLISIFIHYLLRSEKTILVW